MYEDKSYEALKEEMLQEITQTDKREGSFVNDMLSAAALQGEKLYVALEHTLAVAFLQNCIGTDADEKAQEEGLSRKAGTKAKGSVTFTGEVGKEIPEGTLCGTVGDLHFTTTETGEIGEKGSVTLPVEAEEIGNKYNVPAGYINFLPVNINGVTSITNAEGTLGGSEKETDAELIARILLKKRTPATSGNKHHYLQWALEVNGVGNAKIFPLDNGPGTVGVMPITGGGRAPSEEILQAVRENIEEQRPIGATVSVYAPEEVQIAVSAMISLSADTALSTVQTAYQKSFEAYIKEGVFRLQAIDYYKCISLLYEISGVTSVKNFRLNGGTESIQIGEKQIQVCGNVSVEVR